MKNITKRSLTCFVLILFASNISLFSQSSSQDYPESSLVRETLVDSWFTQDLELLRAQSSQVLQNDLGEYFLIRAEEKDGTMEVILAPLVLQTLAIRDFALDSTTEEDFSLVMQSPESEMTIETWPKNGIGSWILYRDSTTGKNICIRYYFTNNNEVFIDFTPGKDKSYASISIFGAIVAHRAPVPVTLEYFYTASFKDIQKLTKNILPWKYVNVHNNVYVDTQQMVRVIRSLLPDAQKANMFNSATSEFDFLKWIVDGLVKPLTGGLLYEEPLYVPTIEPDFMIPHRQETHKSYDYIRNLAAASLSADTALSYTYETSGADVKIEPFSLFSNADGVRERVNFVTDIGYQVELLQPLLYILTATEGDLFFLGAIREVQEAQVMGRTAEQYYYDNAVSFFSWFDEDGVFQTTVFENGAEFTFEQFLKKYEDAFVYLVRIKPSVSFSPERPPEAEENLAEENIQ